MDIVIVQGTYHTKGATASLVDHFVRGAKEADPDNTVTCIDLLKANVLFCIGCSKCQTPDDKELGTCPLQDDMADILQKLLHCDLVVFATPIYYWAPTALMKRFLERTYPTCKSSPHGPPVHRNKKRKGKKGVILLSSGFPYPLNVLLGQMRYSKKVLSMTCKLLGCEKNYVLNAGHMEEQSKTRDKWNRKAYRLGVKLGKN